MPEDSTSPDERAPGKVDDGTFLRSASAGGFSADDLFKAIQDHNRQHLIWAGLSLVAALILWPASYIAAQLLVGVIANALVVTTVLSKPPADWVLIAGAGVFMVILLIDGLRVYSASLSEVSANGPFQALGPLADDPSTNSPPRIALDPRRLPLTGWMLSPGWGAASTWVVSQFLFCAPRATLAAIRHWRLRLGLDWDRDQAMLKLVDHLGARAEWTAFTSVAGEAPLSAFITLHKMEILWNRVHRDRLEVRLASDFWTQHFGSPDKLQKERFRKV